MEAHTPSHEPGRVRRENLEFEVLHLVESEPGISQREIARRLRISLGRVNSCMKALMELGTVRHVSYRSVDQRLHYTYELTPGGKEQRVSLTGGYLQRKLAEFERLKAQIEGLQSGMNRAEGA
jgi:MarR family transcriptional regulator, temperature-dependent positive regulator of motility